MNATPVNWTGNLPGGLNSLNTDWIPPRLENGFPVVEPVYDVHRVKVGDGNDIRHLSLLVSWKRCEVVK